MKHFETKTNTIIEGVVFLEIEGVCVGLDYSESVCISWKEMVDDFFDYASTPSGHISDADAVDCLDFIKALETAALYAKAVYEARRSKDHDTD